jgi:LacI family transcriptional regulator
MKVSANSLDNSSALLYNLGMATIYDVAKQAGVSTATVSRSFSKAGSLSDETRQRVLAVAAQLNYRPRRAQPSRSPAAGDRQIVLSNPIGFQFFGISETATVQGNSFYAPLLQGAQDEATAEGIHLLLYSMYRHDPSYEMPETIRARQVAGILLVGAADAGILETFFAHIPKVVMVDNRDLTGRYDAILSDGFSGAYSAVEYLVGLGHRRIAFAMSEPQTLSFRDRLHGYVAAHFDRCIGLDTRLALTADTVEDFGPRMHDLLASAERPTAILAANDVHAYIVMQVARDLGLDIPGDLSVIGFDDEKYSALSYPPLTTVLIDKEYMGRLAVRRLLRRLREGTDPPEGPVQIEVPVTLVIRESCSRPRG